MSRNRRWYAAVFVALGLASGRAEGQFFGGGFWGEGFGGVGTVDGDFGRGAGMFAMGLGRYNLDTAEAMAIDADTMKRWNQYIYNSRVEAARNYRERVARQDRNRRENSEAIRLRLRNAPNQVDITSGNAPNVVLDEVNDPRVFSKAVYYGARVKLGGDSIRDIPFAYASAAISTSVNHLVQGPPPASLRRPEFAPDLDALKAIAVELKTQSEELGEDKPETIRKAKDLILALRAKVEATFPGNSQEFRDANRYLKALNGLVSMLESPAVNVLLAGVESRPEATVGDLLAFMSAYNLRFGAAQTPRQRQVLLSLHPMLTRIRDEVAPAAVATAPPTTPDVEDAPVAVFDGLGYRHAETAPSRTAPK